MPCSSCEEIHFEAPSNCIPEDVFYWRPKRLATASLPDGACAGVWPISTEFYHMWYNSVPIGHNTQEVKMKDFWLEN